jgi:hypothetical protein
MVDNEYYVRISPEVIQDDIFQVCYPSGTTYPSGCTYVYSSMTEILSGGTGGTSLLTGLTIPILFTQSGVDVGYYSIFDGAISQADVVRNFLFSATTGSPNKVYFYNTSETQYKSYLLLSSYTVDWGDGSPIQTITTNSPNYITHDYLNNGVYTIVLSQNNPWGVNTVKKTVTIPYTPTTITNPNGTAYFTPNIGSWSATPISYDYIFSGDAINLISAQTSDKYVSVPFLMSGYTKSRVTELASYGTPKYQLNTPIYDVNNQIYGYITSMTPQLTGYTIQDVNYVDFVDGTTIFILDSYGLTADWMVEEPMVKDEALLNVVMQPEVQSDIFIERGKNAVIEKIERLGEVDNIGDLKNYGYGYFNFRIAQNLR